MESKITIYRGSHQIGGCVTEIKTKEHRIIIDFGANLPGCKTDGAMTDEELVDKVFDGTPCDGVLFTHYHGDHIGMYKKIPQGIPMYIGPTAKKILEILTERLDKIPGTKEKGLDRIKSMKTYRIASRIDAFGDIKVTPFLVDHSALDTYMFLIQIEGKRLLFTGDFREHGIVGNRKRRSFERMLHEYIGKVDILVTEGTMLSRLDEKRVNPIQTEDDLGRRARELFKRNKESVIMVSSTNLDSIMEYYHALPEDMGFVCDAYQAKVMLAAMEDKGKYPLYRPKMIDGKPRPIYIVGSMEKLGAKENCYKADFKYLMRSGFTMLARENKEMFGKIMAKFHDPLIIYSKWTGYLEGVHADPKVKAFIGNHRMEKVHSSGHAYVETIEKLIRITNPKVIIPMHTERADEFAEMPEFAPYKDRVCVLTDGIGYEFEAGNMNCIRKTDEGYEMWLGGVCTRSYEGNEQHLKKFIRRFEKVCRVEMDFDEVCRILEETGVYEMSDIMKEEH